MSDLVGNSRNRFCYDEAYNIKLYYVGNYISLQPKASRISLALLENLGLEGYLGSMLIYTIHTCTGKYTCPGKDTYTGTLAQGEISKVTFKKAFKAGNI